MTNETGYTTFDEATEAALNLLKEINKEGELKADSYLRVALTTTRVADSFKDIGDTPVTPFDVPREKEEANTYELVGISKKTGEPVGGRAYIYREVHHYPNDHTEFALSVLSVEETDNSCYTLPFRNLTQDKIYIFARFGINFAKPVTPISIDEALTFEGEKLIRSYLNSYHKSTYWSYDIDEDKYINGAITKEELFQVEDEEAEANPEDYPDTYRNNIVLTASPSPSLLSRATGKKIVSAKNYASAIEQIIGSPLDDREKKVITSAYEFTTAEQLLEYATYEFARTEKYTHLKEILSHAPDFGLSSKWEKDCLLLWEWDREYKKKLRLSAEEYVLSKYLRNDYSNLLSPLSFREIAQATETPLSVISKAAKYNV